MAAASANRHHRLLCSTITMHHAHMVHRACIARPSSCAYGLRRAHAVVRVAAAAGGQTLVVVESPTKAKKIQAFLGDGYKVLASYGHVRDLPAKDGAVDPDQNFHMQWHVPPRAKQRLDEIQGALPGCSSLVLATDPDREGEAISWHIMDELQRRGKLHAGYPVSRITFTEITKKAVLHALDNGRKVSDELVHAYMARRALDFLVGFGLSPVLWRRLPGARSAGRVQSVALRLLCEREAQIEAFKPQQYWTIQVQLAVAAQGGGAGCSITARLTHVGGKRLGPLGITDGAQAAELEQALQSSSVRLAKKSQRSVRRAPSPPFITSTLQQEAARKLGFYTSHTMRMAQELYEGAGTGEGLITYMRTDGVYLSDEAVAELRRTAATAFGNACVPVEPRAYKSRAKNAQEAHEAVRPTRPARLTPDKLDALGLTPDQRALYELVWRRAVASQMADAVFDQVSADFEAMSGSFTMLLHAGGRKQTLPGYLAVYDDASSAAEERAEAGEAQLSHADSDDDTRVVQGGAASALASLQDSAPVSVLSVSSQQHATRPPQRYSEAGLVKALEERGIGRPSTYAPIIQVLKARGYISSEQRSLQPSALGRVTNAFLEHYFPKYVDYAFTSDMEEQLDRVAGGQQQWQPLLGSFYGPFHQNLQQVLGLTTTEVFNMLDAALEPFLFPAPPPPAGANSQGSATAALGQAGSDAAATRALAATSSTGSAGVEVSAARRCPKCGVGRLVLKPSRYGSFIGCTGYSKDGADSCAYSRPLLTHDAAHLASADTDGSMDGGDGQGAAVYERELGLHPETGLPVLAKVGPYGLYVETAAPTAADDSGAEGSTGSNKGKRGAKTKAKAKTKPRRASLPKAKGFTIGGVTLEQALAALALPREVGRHPADGTPVLANVGRFGPYVTHGGVFASLTAKKLRPEDVDLATALELLQAKRAALEAKGKLPAEGSGLAAKGRAKGKGNASAATTAEGKVSKAAVPTAGAATRPSSGKRSGKTGYVLFMQHQWQAKKAADPGASYRAAVSEIAEVWKQLDDSSREYWVQLAQAQAQQAGAAGAAGDFASSVAVGGHSAAVPAPEKRAQRSSEAADATGGNGKEKKVRVAAAVAEPGSQAVGGSRSTAAVSSEGRAPRTSPYMAFCKHQRAAVKAARPDASFGEVAKLLGAAWHALSDDERARYQ